MARRPHWLKVRAPSATEAEGVRAVRDLLAKHHLTTVCQGAVCPNAGECWGARTATFMILGDTCTRGCRFCGVPTGNPGGDLDRGEPDRLAKAIAELGLRYVVLTSVDRDDLPDGGAGAFAETVRRIKSTVDGVRVEILIPDFSGDRAALAEIRTAGADVIGHNLETVERLSPEMRDRRASYRQSLDVLAALRADASGYAVKSGLMLGLGERVDEVRQALRDLREAGVQALTLGQYLQPTVRSAPVDRFVPPEEFEALADEARDLGFSSVVAGPLVRSSYHAAQEYERLCG